jgi:hypothetical protein
MKLLIMQVKEDEIGAARSTHGRNETYLSGNLKGRPLGRRRRRWENISMYLREIG